MCVCVRAGACVREGSSPEPAEGSALIFVVGSGVGLPALLLRRLVVDVGRRAREVVRILLHHLQLGLDGADLGAGAGEEGEGETLAGRRLMDGARLKAKEEALSVRDEQMGKWEEGRSNGDA